MAGATLVATDLSAAAATLVDSAQQPVLSLAPYLKEFWDSDEGIALVSGAVNSWTGQKLGIVLSAPAASNRPAYGADSTYFRGRDVVQCATTGSKYLRLLDYGSDLWTGGAASTPYLLAIGRLRTPSSVDSSRAVALMPASSAEHVYLGHSITTGINRSFVRDSGTTNRNITGDAGSTSVCMWEGWAKDGANVRTNMGTTYTNAGADGIAADIGGVRRIGVGARGDSYNPTDYSFRFIALCNSKPPDALLREVYAYFRGDSGF